MCHSTNNRKPNKRLLADLILAVVCLLIAGIALLLFRAFSPKAGYVKVTVDGGEAIYYSLAENGRYKISGVDGGYDVLCIEDGYAWFEEATCPDKLCEKTGKISRGGERIVCLPNRVIAEIVGEAREVDVVS